MTSCILIVDDDPVQCRILQAAVNRFGFDAVTVNGAEAGLEALQNRDYSAVILDLVMPGMDGLEMLRRMQERDMRLPVIVQTAKGGVETAVAAMRAGAFDFVVKPVSPEKLKTTLGNALKVEKAGGAVRKSRKTGKKTFDFTDIVTTSPEMDRVIRLGTKASSSTIPVLIEGESGVGKELVARAIQGAGDRQSRPFVTVNCGAIPDNLVESILFGHEKGSFTGASEKHVGKFMEANGGTLFLDEIGDLPMDVQVKLLRAVQEGEVDPVGGKTTVKVDIRLISATHRDLLQRVKDGLFREDLYYRLNVFPIHVPPLRRRKEDIPRLIRHFISRISPSEAGGSVTGIDREALSLLERYDWPGNIRQLENAILRALVLCEGDVLTVDEFPQIRAQVEGIDTQVDAAGMTAGEERAGQPRAASIDTPAAGSEAESSADDQDEESRFGILHALDDGGDVRPLADIEEELIKFALNHYNGQMSEIARRLGIGRSTLYRKLKDMGIDPDEPRAERLAS